MIDECWRIYIKPYDEQGVLTDWIQVTEDVKRESLGTIQQDVDNSDYDIGIYRNSSLTITLRNEHGRYSDVDVLQSIFRYKRSGCPCKVTWEPNSNPALLGSSFAGEDVLTEEVEVFSGLLNDESLAMDLDSQQVQFIVLGRESIFESMKVPYGSMTNGELVSSIIYKCLNDPRVTEVVTVDAGLIDVDVDVAVDDVLTFENKTVRQTINDLLLASNSVLFIEDDSVKVQKRDASPDVKFTFFGQGSSLGVENIANIKGIKNGLSRTMNFVVWTDTSLKSEDLDSQEKYGVKRKSIEMEYFTLDATRQLILDGIKSEFGAPKREFDLYTPMSYETLALKNLNRVAIDYPIVYIPTSGNPLPICGLAVCGQAVLPRGLWSFSVDTFSNWKITGRHIDMKNSLMKFRMREI